MSRLEQRRAEMEALPEKVFLCQREWKKGRGEARADDSKVASGSEGPSRSRVQYQDCSLRVSVCVLSVCVWRAGGGASTCWMNQISIGEYHGLRVGSALLCIVAGCIIIGVSRECDADAVGGIFLGAGGLGECVWNLLLTHLRYLVSVKSHWLLFAS